MLPLYAFARKEDLPAQTINDAFGAISVDKFRLTSSFPLNAEQKFAAYAMLPGTVLLQQVTGDYVNLILRPKDTSAIKLPVKYIIYRGLNINDFLTSNNITDAATTVKTTGLEILVKMKTIQDEREPGTAIPVTSLFGKELTPALTINIDELFKGGSAPSQLFDIDGGIHIGNFYGGPTGTTGKKAGIDIVLHNPEYFPDVDMAKKTIYELDVSSITDANKKKSRKEQLRHFVDVAAFYGLHHDIDGGIGHIVGTAAATGAIGANDVYNKIQTPFFTKNTVYLDIRNENDYSYNYYENYVGTSGNATNDAKEIKTGATATALTLQEYYTNGWPIHIVSGIVPGTTATNTFYLSLRINDNNRPLLAGWNADLTPNTVIDPPLANKIARRIYYVDELLLLPVPIPAVLPEFTNAIGIQVPNVSTGTPSQPATIVKLTYIKQALPLSPANIFPKKSLTDYLFGPLDITIPWDTANKIKWFSSQNNSYVDALSDGYIIGQYKTTILSINTTTKEIEIFDEVPVDITKQVKIENSGNTLVGTYTPVANGVTYAGGKTKIKVAETIGALQAGDKLSLAVTIEGKMDYSKNIFVIANKNYVGIEALAINNKLEFYSRYDFANSYTISSVTFVSPDTHVLFSVSKPKTGFAGFAETGLILETDLTTSGPSNNDRVMFYAAPFNYFTSNGIIKSASFAATGGILDYESILKALEAMMPGVVIEKVNLNISAGNNVLAFAYTSASKAKEALFLLGLTKAEWEAIKTTVGTTLDATRHKQMFRLISTGTGKTDLNKKAYSEYDLYVAGLTSTNSYQTVNTGIKIYTTDHLIFNSKSFSAIYGIDVTIAEQAVMDFITDTLDGDGSEFLELTKFSDEEKSNLHKDKSWNHYGTGKSNKELFNLEPVPVPTTGPSFKNIIRNLKTQLDSVAETDTAIKNLLDVKGGELLTHAKKQIQDIDPGTNAPRPTASVFKNKDGILYLSRLIMQVILKNHPKILSKFPSRIDEFSDVFEKASRGLDGPGKPLFDPATSNKFNLLISGYDPFQGGMDKDDYQSNASGNLALSLDGLLTDTPGTGKQISIKSVIFPVRFREFDEGWIERFFKPYVDDANINMIITFSYGIESTKYNFEIERFAARKRGIGSSDNNEKISVANPYLDNADKDDYEFLETRLPYRDMFITDEVGLDQAITLQFYNGSISVASYSEANPSNNLTTSKLIPFPDFPNYKDKLASGQVANRIKSIEGPGGDYLSNEIYYRVAYLREISANPAKPTGHIHLGFLKNNTPPAIRANREHMLSIIKQSILKIIPSLAMPSLSGFMKILDNGYTGNDFFTGLTHTNEEQKQLSTIWLSNGAHIGNKAVFELDPSMKLKVIAFKHALDQLPNTLADVKKIIEEKATDLLYCAKAHIKGISPYTRQVISPVPTFKNKDGILYITRMMMQVILKNHPKILASFSSSVNDLYDLFEKYSRGHIGKEKPDFSTVPSGHKKILISGFDPYGAGFDWEDHNSNPSGNLLMALDGSSITDGTKTGHIKGALFPVRYKEFDANWVETFFNDYINNVDMIITFSYGIDSKDFQIDRFASDFRYGTLKENDDQTTPNTNLQPSATFIENKLPYTALASGNLLTLSGPCKIGINHRAYWEITADKISPSVPGENVTNLHSLKKTFGTFGAPYTYWSNKAVLAITKIAAFNSTDFSNNSQVSDDLKYVTPGNADEIKFPSWANYPDTGAWASNYNNFKIIARMGSGQFYLSNEIHYRVARLRNTLRPNLKTGHIHIGFLTGDPVTDRNEMITAAQYIIEKMLNAL